MAVAEAKLLSPSPPPGIPTQAAAAQALQAVAPVTNDSSDDSVDIAAIGHFSDVIIDKPITPSAVMEAAGAANQFPIDDCTDRYVQNVWGR